MNIVFFGSDDFAVASLKALLASRHKVVSCVTPPDKPQGRGLNMAFCAVKQYALDHNLPYLQPSSLKTDLTLEALKAFDADLFVVVAYGRLLTQEVLNIPKIFCVNVHGSLLPQYRGAAPINWAILHGQKTTGVTVQKMVLGLDAGDSIVQEKVSIGAHETAVQLRERMAHVGGKILVRALDQIAAKQYKLTPQDETKVTLAPKLTKDLGKIDWSKSAGHIYNQIRGLQPWPGAFTTYQGKMLKIIKVEITNIDSSAHKPGLAMVLDKHGFTVATADKWLLIQEVHPEAGKVMSAVSFMAGYKIGGNCFL